MVNFWRKLVNFRQKPVNFSQKLVNFSPEPVLYSIATAHMNAPELIYRVSFPWGRLPRRSQGAVTKEKRWVRFPRRTQRFLIF